MLFTDQLLTRIDKLDTRAIVTLTCTLVTLHFTLLYSNYNFHI